MQTSNGNNGGALAALRLRTLTAFSYPLGRSFYATTIDAGRYLDIPDTTSEAAAALVAIHNDGIPTHAGRGCGASGCLDWSPHARRAPDSRRVQAENAGPQAVVL